MVQTKAEKEFRLRCFRFFFVCQLLWQFFVAEAGRKLSICIAPGTDGEEGGRGERGGESPAGSPAGPIL